MADRAKTRAGVKTAPSHDSEVVETLPQDHGAERAVLGAVLLSNDAYFEAGACGLVVEDFSLDFHRRLWRAIAALMTAQKPVDLITLPDQLRAQGELGAVGGVSYVAELTTGISKGNIAHHVEILREKRLRREVVHLSNRAIQQALDPGEPVNWTLEAIASDSLTLRGDSGRKRGEFVKEFTRDIVDDLERRMYEGREVIGLPFGIQDLDEKTTGIRDGELAILGGFTGCVAPETVIAGIPIAERKREVVSTLFGHVLPSNPYRKGLADLYEVATRGGSRLAVTLDHRFLTPSGWVRLRHLSVGDLIAADGIGRDYAEKETGQGFPDCNSSCPHPRGELPQPEAVALRDISRQLHTKDVCDSATMASYRPSIGRCIYRDSLCRHTHRGAKECGQVECSGCCYSALSGDTRAPSQSTALRAQVGSRYQAVEVGKPLESRSPGCASPRWSEARRLRAGADCESIWRPLRHCQIPHIEPRFRGQSRSGLGDDLRGSSAFWDEIIRVKFVRHGEFYDLAVPLAEHYSAHGLWHHNSGKTAFAGTIVLNNIQQGVPVAFFSVEMKREAVAMRILSQLSGIGHSRLRRPYNLTSQDIRELRAWKEKLDVMPLIIDDDGMITAVELEARARLYIAKHGVKLIVVDYLQMVWVPQAEKEYEQVSFVADTLVRLAKRTNVPVLALSQLSRPSDKRENPRPHMALLRSSGKIEQHAHLVLFTHRPMDEQNEGTGEDEIIIGKQRAGATGIVKATYDTRVLRWEGRARKEEPEQTALPLKTNGKGKAKAAVAGEEAPA